MDVEGPTKPVEDLNKICHQIPIHLILGKVGDLMYVNLFFLSSFLVFFFSFFLSSFFAFPTTLFLIIFRYFTRPTHVHKALVDPNSGRQYASIVWISGIGHLVRTNSSLVPPPPRPHLFTLYRSFLTPRIDSTDTTGSS